MKKYFILAIILLHTCAALGNLRTLPTPLLLDSLDTYLRQTAAYDQQARRRISELKHRASELPASARPEVYRSIGQLYFHADLDSALHYFELGRQLAALTGDYHEATRLQLSILRAIPYKGMLHNAFAGIDKINPDTLTSDLRTYYYGTRHHIYRIAVDVVASDSLRHLYTADAVRSVDSLLQYLPPDNVTHLYFRAVLALSQTDTHHKDVYLDRLRVATDTMSVDDAMFPLSTAMLAYVAERRGTPDDAMRYLALSAIGDIRQGNAEGTSLYRLGKMLQATGETERAYRYLTTSIERSTSAGARIRSLEAAEALPYILETSQALHARTLFYLYATIAVLALLLIVTVVVLVLLKRRQKQLYEDSLQQRTAISNRNEYIRRLLQLCVDSFEDYDRLEVHVSRKIKAHQTIDLLEQLNSDERRQKRLQQLQVRFDNAFLALHPDFVSRINTLLADDRKFDEDPSGSGSLNPELRLLALLSVGITDSQDLARMLGLTLNTVYTYRTRIKNRASDRATFEETVRNMSLTV